MSRSVRTDYEALRVFEKHPVAEAYHVGGSFTPYAIVAVDKRFTDAELAGIYWGCAFEVLDARDMGRLDYSQSRLRESVTLWRFATLPSYDE